MNGYDLSISIIKCVFGSFISPLYNFSLAGNICQVRVQRGKNTVATNNIKG